LYLLSIFLPFISLILVIFYCRLIGFKGVKIFLFASIFTNNLICIYLFILFIKFNDPVYIKIGNWISSNLLIVNWGFYFDAVTCVILVVITTISSLVHLYSCNYIQYDPHLIRFIFKLTLFTFFILLLVTSDNFVKILFFF
jgi:NADH-quinone oxidoreductase subunit L